MENYNIEQFDNYINGTLSAADKQKFDERLNSDKAFAEDFKIFLFTIRGIQREAEQDNIEFGHALKNISKEQLCEIIGKRRKPTFRLTAFRERIAWASSIAAMFIVGLFSIFSIEKNYDNKIDVMLVDRYFIAEAKGDGLEQADIIGKSTKEMRDILPLLEKDYANAPADDPQLCEAAGMRLALGYLQSHDRKKAKKLLNELKARFADDEEFVAQCDNILKELD